MTLSNCIIYGSPHEQITNKHIYWDRFQEEASKHIDVTTVFDYGANLRSTFTTILLEKARNATPTAALNLEICHSKKVIKSIRQRRKALHLWKSSRDPQHKKVFKKAK